MSGDSFPLDLSLPRFATDSCEAATLFLELRKLLLRYLAGLGLSGDEAQAVAQDAFLSLPAPCNRRVAGRIAVGYFISPQPGPELSAELCATHGWALDRSLTCYRVTRLRAGGAGPGEVSRLDRAIRSLEWQERECLMLRAEGLRYREIGEVLGIPTSTVADMVDRAIKKLAEKCNV
jgi:RNA polymerase sigma-70 factor (ECF subfamily)